MFEPAVDPNNPSSQQTPGLDAQLKAEFQRFYMQTENLTKATQELMEAGENLNKAFLGSRQRLDEFLVNIRQATPEMMALGASTKDIYDTLSQIATGSRRQVIASAQDLRELFSASKLVGKSTNELVEAFGKVGYNYGQVADEVLNSITQINRFGLNARVVMEEVYKNTEQLSRFSFDKGVEGLTKMAAQASMLRFDMNQTFTLAEKVLDPDQAVSVASAFQRLGVAAGNLVDPMALLNQSLTDPSGLQNSLINVARQFTYFDEQTNSFRINPQGILTLKEIESQTGVSAKAMREAALAAADLDRRLAVINKGDFSIGMSEQDKTLLANIARYGEKGELEVKVSRPGEIAKYEEISKLSGDQMRTIVEEQKRIPQTIEEIQKAQLTTGEKTLAEFKKLNAILAGSLLDAPGYLKTIQDISGNFRQTVEGLDMSVVPEFRAAMEKSYQDLEKANTPEARNKAYRDIMLNVAKYGDDMLSNFSQTLSEASEGTFVQDIMDNLTDGLNALGVSLPSGTATKVKSGGIIIPGGTETKTKEEYKPIYGPSNSLSPMGRGFILPGAGMPGAKISINIENQNNVENPKFQVAFTESDLKRVLIDGSNQTFELLASKLKNELKKVGFQLV